MALQTGGKWDSVFVQQDLIKSAQNGTVLFRESYGAAGYWSAAISSLTFAFCSQFKQAFLDKCQKESLSEQILDLVPYHIYRFHVTAFQGREGFHFPNAHKLLVPGIKLKTHSQIISHVCFDVTSPKQNILRARCVFQSSSESLSAAECLFWCAAPIFSSLHWYLHSRWWIEGVSELKCLPFPADANR